MKDPEFWLNKWATNEIGFHLEDVNPLLIQFWKHASATRSDKVLVPLCGKSEDLIWLASKHDDVRGVDLSNIAVRAFFAEHFYTPLVTNVSGQHELYQFDELSIVVGDIFTAPLDMVDLVYDRAALVALPLEMRSDYAKRIQSLLNLGGKILLINLDYEQSEMAGPPFSVPEEEIKILYSDCIVTKLQRKEAGENHPKRVEKGMSRFAEEVYLLEKVK
ncbi:thiopurine S-methyltransferase [Vibrio caribbeanicus]|uniref:thiopurine S-methyltransferase n=1 Tax=Vibrio caribbeanicus TaxID=701175 RepID=UPI002283743E|nr:thiopurine S-methyltransferase [Vibrio caribbeanicus]MCY9846029.1 thiopurine S-methyltransferase [Vibrio caribbeanicus]